MLAHSHRIALPVALLLTVAPFAGRPAVAAGANDRDCFHQLEKGRGPELVCEFPTKLTDDERRDLRSVSRDLVQDAICVVSIRIDRRLVEEALAADDIVFEAPPQAVRCEITTRESMVPVTASFAPRVVITGGEAVEASPGLGQVAGVSSVLAWPVVQYVNRAGNIQDGMLAVINAYRTLSSRRREAQHR